MFKVIKDGAVLAMTEAPNYIRLQANGCFGLCSEVEAEGIALNGRVYHMMGRPDLEGVETVVLAEVDAGMELTQMGTAIGQVNTAVDDLIVAALMGGNENV